MKVSEVMIGEPAAVTPEDAMSRAAHLISELHSSLVPVVNNAADRHIVGIITDEDVMRCTASGNNPAECPVRDYMGTTFETVNVNSDVETALAEVPSPGDRGSGSGENDSGLIGRRPIVVVDDLRRVVGLLTRPHLAMDIARLQSGQLVSGRTESMQLVWRCTDCGYLLTRAEHLPDACPDCGAPKEHFVLVTED